MKKAAIKLFFAVFIIFFIATTENLFACSCGSSAPIYEYYEKSSAVFIGKVIGSKDIETKEIEEHDGEKLEYSNKERVFYFEVIEVFKGIEGSKVNVNVGSVNSSCYSGFAIGESYLIYARGGDEENLSHGFCSRSEHLPYAQDQIYFIREKLKGNPEAQIYGSVVRSDRHPNTTKHRVSPLGSIKIILEGKQKRFETTTDKNGLFKFNKIPDGDYSLKPDSPSIYTSFFPTGENIKILKGKVFLEQGFFDYGYKAAFAEFTLGWNNSVKGKVYDAEGKFVKYAAVRLLPVSLPFEKIESDYILDKLRDGKYECSNKTPGKYFLVTEIYAPFVTKDKVRIFYPQAESPEKATPINLRATDNLNFDIILPAKFILREIKGTIAWSDGQVADQARITLYKTDSHKEIEDNDKIENHGYDWEFTDEQGNFVLYGFENAEYWLYVEDEFNPIVNEEEVEIEVKAKPIKIKVQKENQPLKIILTKPEDK